LEKIATLSFKWHSFQRDYGKNLASGLIDQRNGGFSISDGQETEDGKNL